MNTRTFLTCALCAGLASPALAQDQDLTQAPPGGNYQQVSELTDLPEFVPGLGILYVQPESLPAGPFLGYDREGNLVNTTYMIPLEALQEHEEFDKLDSGPAEVHQTDIHFNPGHPGVEEPHYHIVLWHVPEDRAEEIAQAE